MCKYIKWDLKDYFSKKTMFFIGVGIVFLLSLIIPYDSDLFIAGLVHFSFFIIMYISLVFSFIIGTKRVIDTFKKKTFLLESMIPLPVKKILLSKFIIGFIINFIYSFIGIIGLAIILFKGADINLFEEFNKFLANINALEFIRVCITYILGILTFMAIVVLGYIISKVIKPNNKDNKILGIIIWIVLFYTISYILATINYDFEMGDLVLDFICIIITLVSYFISAWLIENKLEIYN